MYFVEIGVPKILLYLFLFDIKLEFFNDDLCKEY